MATSEEDWLELVPDGTVDLTIDGRIKMKMDGKWGTLQVVENMTEEEKKARSIGVPCCRYDLDDILSHCCTEEGYVLFDIPSQKYWLRLNGQWEQRETLEWSAHYIRVDNSVGRAPIQAPVFSHTELCTECQNKIKEQTLTSYFPSFIYLK